VAAPAKGRSIAWTTTVLALVGFLAAVDRQTFSVLLVPIQKDLKVSDAAMGLLTGSAFALIYAFVALPLSRLADRSNRRNIIGISVVIWSAATALCGVVTGFIALLLARVGVGAAESAQLPASMSMISDLAPGHKRGGQIAILSAGAAMGFALGGIIAGVLNDHFGWHVAMMAVGAPGILLGIVIFLTVPEPRRGAHDNLSASPATPVSWLGSLRRCARIKTLYPFVGGYFFTNLAQSGWLIWTPAYLMRVHHLTATQMGGVFGAIVGAGVLGTLIGGFWGDRLAKRGPRYRLYFCCASLAVGTPFLFFGLLAPTLPVAVGCMLAFTLCNGGLTPGATAIYLAVAPANIRGTVTAMMNIIALGLGGGLAPVLFGAVNDALRGAYGEVAVRYTLLLAPATLALAGVMYFVASRFIDHDVAQVMGAAAD
jgi:predicted MFS family arabinose efflux permease